MRYSPKYYVDMKSFSLSCKDGQDKDDWRLRIKRLLADPALAGKWPLKRVCASVCVAIQHACPQKVFQLPLCVPSSPWTDSFNSVKNILPLSCDRFKSNCLNI